MLPPLGSLPVRESCTGRDKHFQTITEHLRCPRKLSMLTSSIEMCRGALVASARTGQPPRTWKTSRVSFLVSSPIACKRGWQISACSLPRSIHCRPMLNCVSHQVALFLSERAVQTGHCLPPATNTRTRNAGLRWRVEASVSGTLHAGHERENGFQSFLLNASSPGYDDPCQTLLLSPVKGIKVPSTGLRDIPGLASIERPITSSLCSRTATCLERVHTSQNQRQERVSTQRPRDGSNHDPASLTLALVMNTA